MYVCETLYCSLILFFLSNDSETNSLFPSLALHLVDGDKYSMANDNLFDLFDSPQTLTPNSGTELKPGYLSQC